jgi:hypothetical protein
VRCMNIALVTFCVQGLCTVCAHSLSVCVVLRFVRCDLFQCSVPRCSTDGDRFTRSDRSRSAVQISSHRSTTDAEASGRYWRVGLRTHIPQLHIHTLQLHSHLSLIRCQRSARADSDRGMDAREGRHTRPNLNRSLSCSTCCSLFCRPSLPSLSAMVGLQWWFESSYVHARLCPSAVHLQSDHHGGDTG